MTPLQLQLMERADKTLKRGCILIKNDDYYMRETKTGDEPEYLMILYSAESVRDNNRVYHHIGYMGHSRDIGLCDEGINKNMLVVGHPYGFDRLLHFALKNRGEENTTEKIIIINNYLDDKHGLLLKPCIDRPNDGQKLVLDFLQTLPSGSI